MVKHDCPYMTGNGKCTHKYKNGRVTKRKRFCGYNNPNNCDMYCEWVEMKEDSLNEERLLTTPLKQPQELSHD